MRILLAGADGAIGKAFAKEHKGKHEIIALDYKKADFSRYEPIKAIFSAYKFDAVLYFAGAGEANLFKNLQFASLLYGAKKMLTVFDAGESFFNALVPNLIQKDKIGSGLKIYGLFGSGTDAKTNAIAKIFADAKKKGAVNLAQDREISAVYIDDAVKVISAFIEKDLPQGVYDLVPAQTTSLLKIAQAVKKHYKEAEGKDVSITVADKPNPLPPFVGNSENLSAVYNAKFTSLNAVIKKEL